MNTSNSLSLLRIVQLLLVALLFPVLALGATNLGSDYSCDNGKITRKGKVVKLAVARSAIDQQIAKLPKTKTGKAKSAVLKALKKALKDCATQTPGGGNGGASIASIFGPRLLGDRAIFSTPISGFGSSPAVASLQVRESSEGYLIILGIGENTPLGERYFGDFEPGPFDAIPTGATVPYTASRDYAAPSKRKILIEATKVTFQWTDIPAGTTRNGVNITEVKAILELTDNGGYTGKLEYLIGTSVVASGTFTFQQ